MEYAIVHTRELKINEIEILVFLFQKEKPEWLVLINELKVIGICGCGKCPTILFGTSFDDKIITNQRAVIDYLGSGINGESIAVTVYGNELMPTELEFSAIDSFADVKEIPALETLK